jgi:hypothetical protein
MFINISSSDYRLRDSSPCKNTASDGYDMGAYLGVWKEPPKPDTVERSQIKQNRPNPFSNNTLIEYQILSRRSSVSVGVEVYNNRGQLVRTLVSEDKTNGNYLTYWNGRNDNGQPASAGCYFCCLRVGGEYVSSIKMMWVIPATRIQ